MHIIPHSTWEWRCAEYGVDPNDMDTLLDIVLHEPWIPDPNDVLSLADPAAAAVLEDTHGLPTCWTPAVSDTVRLQAQLARVEAVKRHRVRMEPETQQVRQGVLAYVGVDKVAPADPLEPIKSLTRLDPVRVESRRLALNWYRDNLQKPARPMWDSKPAGAFVGRKPWGGVA
ncbi:hypothetical protein ACQPYK_25555 [Streptosporangium sp. CA-135522]|uniref:hypothetical protein n=1 Tax=Streptosporangium sp. CA-135522 TaxID=3240072 RepID=UPI003D91D6D8